MDFTIFFKGLLTGLAVAAPVGPIGILCIQRTLARGREVGLVSFLGAATADAIYGLIVASGLFLFIHLFLENHQDWIQMVGGLFLSFLGFRTFFAHPHADARPCNRISLVRAYASSLFLALTSPSTLVGMLVVLVALKAGCLDSNRLHSTVLATGIFLGSASWWLVLAGSMALLGVRRDHALMLWVNRIGGALLTGFGILLLIKWIF